MKAEDWDPTTYARNVGYVAKLGAPLIGMLASHEITRVLDLGCGDGELTARIADKGYEVVGIDSSPEMVRATKQRGITAYLMNGENISLPREFDAVVSNAALHWMPNADAVLRGVRSVLVEGGTFVAEFGGHGNIARIIEIIQNSLMVLNREALFENPWYFPASDEYKGRLEANGFTVVEISSFARPTPLSEGLVGWLSVFARDTIESLLENERERFFKICEEYGKEYLWSPGSGWIADYVRLRFEAQLTPGR